MNSTVYFTSDLHPYLGESHENSFYSPFSLISALGMCAAGAKGKTLSTLNETLGLPKENTKQYLADLIGRIQPTDDYELKTANALWPQKGLPFNPEFAKTITEDFKGNFTELDYSKPASAVETINSWCNENTNGKIPTIINENFINPDLRLILTNAIYFKGKWETQFKKENTKKKPFYGEKEKEVDTMQLTEKFRYCENQSFQAVELPYKGDGLSMLLILPQKNIPIKTIELALSESYQVAVDSLNAPEKVVVSLPKFQLTTEYRLGRILGSMGASLAFSDGADFSGITTADRLKISEVIHKAFVAVDEEGTEAAAATAVGMMRCASFRPTTPPKVFNADHPFLFFIKNEQNDILFGGRVAKPGE